MLVLAFDTATLYSAIGWIRTAGDSTAPIEAFAETTAPAAPGHAETLVARIEELLATGGHHVSEVQLVVCGRGPGTFTGLRIGISTAKGLALAGGIPLIGLSSLEALALSAEGTGPIATLIDAKRGELYAAVYDVECAGTVPRAVVAEQLVAPADLPQVLASAGVEGPVRLAGNGALAYRDQLTGVGDLLPERAIAPSGYWLAVAGLARFHADGAGDPTTLEPVYLRAPDARLPTKR